MAILSYSSAPEHPYISGLHLVERHNRSSQAVLLLHGFSGTPYELLSLAEVIPEEWDLSAPVLPGHGSHPTHLSSVSYQDWVKAAREAYRSLRNSASFVGACGLSMGGALAQLLLLEDPPPDRVILLATPERIEDRRGKWVLPLVRMLNLRKRWIYLKEGGSDISLPEERFRLLNYRWVPLESLAELNALLQYLRRLRIRAPVPTLLLHSRRDHTAPFTHAQRLLNRLGAQATLVALKRSYHVLTRDKEKKEVARVCLEFLRGTPPQELPLPEEWEIVPPPG